mmetsp:Transcript_63105/g.100173  ORF Transcript_63105/g.100173 Transcript_63105/m.100173 type:complete len:267 (+) Transcript_63105:51-851(+)
MAAARQRVASKLQSLVFLSMANLFSLATTYKVELMGNDIRAGVYSSRASKLYHRRPLDAYLFREAAWQAKGILNSDGEEEGDASICQMLDNVDAHSLFAHFATRNAIFNADAKGAMLQAIQECFGVDVSNIIAFVDNDLDPSAFKTIWLKSYDGLQRAFLIETIDSGDASKSFSRLRNWIVQSMRRDVLDMLESGVLQPLDGVLWKDKFKEALKAAKNVQLIGDWEEKLDASGGNVVDKNKFEEIWKTLFSPKHQDVGVCSLEHPC